MLLFLHSANDLAFGEGICLFFFFNKLARSCQSIPLHSLCRPHAEQNVIYSELALNGRFIFPRPHNPARHRDARHSGYSRQHGKLSTVYLPQILALLTSCDCRLELSLYLSILFLYFSLFFRPTGRLPYISHRHHIRLGQVGAIGQEIETDRNTDEDFQKYGIY